MGPDAPKLSILLVDDEYAVLKIVKLFLERAGYEVLTAYDGADGARVFQEHGDRIALVLSDVVMPRMDGFELAGIIRTKRPDLPVVFISGTVPEADCGWGIVSKPFTYTQIIDKVRAVLAKAEDTGLRPEAATDSEGPTDSFLRQQLAKQSRH